jgi:hypothetical protein
MPGRALLSTPLVGVLDRYFKPHLDQMQHVPVDNSARH